ncbi:restriction endonuclease subunit S [Acinetobacter pittii]|uniref:restriction endonuclease subunit S n=1 Tax=Acinetobacter pittii TaxID=48296 RepID=UPI003260567E
MKQQTEFGEIPVEWQVKQVIDIKDESKRAIAMGPFGSNIKAENFVSEGVPVIRGTNMNYAKFVDGDFVYLTEDKADDLIGSNCKPYDLVFTHRGTIGQVALIPDNKFQRYVISQSGMKLTVNSQLMDSEFLFYFFKSEYGQYQILKYESQVGVPSISNPLTSLKEMAVPVPPLPEQKVIASVLSSLDDKIDLLHRQNKTLEEMAETLFRQWFIEEVKEDWKLGTLEHLIDLKYGKALKQEDRSGSGYPVVASSGVVGFHNEYLVEGPGIVIGRKGTLGKVYFMEDSFYPIDTSYFIKTKIPESNLLFEYYLLKSSDFANMNSDSAVPGLNRNLALGTPVQIPPLERIAEFNKLAKPWFSKIYTNTKQIQTLEKIRDTLLPKLMSGEVRVEYKKVDAA